MDSKSLKRYFPIFVFPTLIAFFIGFIWPFLQGIYLSFHEFRTVNDVRFTGVENFRQAVRDPEFLRAFVFTCLFTVATLLIINVTAFFIAMALTQKFRGVNLYRTVFFMPNLIGGIVLGYIWQLIFNGVLAHFNMALKTSTAAGFWGLVILVSWQQIGYMMIIYIAGLQAIPGELYEAAQVDGAGFRHRLFCVILPNLMPSITICTFLTVTNGFKLFDQNLSLTNGQPNNTTELLALNIFRTFYGRVGFQGVGQAKAVLFFLVVVGIGLLQLKLTRSKEVQQ